jgi:hypothetical protein
VTLGAPGVSGLSTASKEPDMNTTRHHHSPRRPAPAAELEQLTLFDVRPFIKGVK